MDRLEQLIANIGKVGLFFNDENEKTYRVGRLSLVTHSGICRDEDGCYYYNFTPMKRADLLECIDSEFFS